MSAIDDLRAGLRPNTNMSLNRLIKNALVVNSTTGEVSVRSSGGGSATSGGLTDAELRASPVEVTAASTTDAVYDPGYSRVTNNGSIAAGKIHVAISNVGTANGTVLGTVLKPGEGVTFASPAEGPALVQDAALSAVSYDATGTEFAIVTLGVL